MYKNYFIKVKNCNLEVQKEVRLGKTKDNENYFFMKKRKKTAYLIIPVSEVSYIMEV